MNMTEFVLRKNQLVAKYGDEIVMAQGARRDAIVKEAEPLARFAKLPVEKFLSAIGALHFGKQQSK